MNVLHAVENWVQTLQQEEKDLATPSLEVAQQIRVQDVETNEQGKARLIKGVAKERRISIEDAEMRHGRKSRSIRMDGDIRHVLHDLDTGLIRAVGITPANVPEASVTREISADLERQPITLKELHIDRAYLSSHLVRERDAELKIYCKAWPVREGSASLSRHLPWTGIGRLFAARQNRNCLSCQVGSCTFPKIPASDALSEAVCKAVRRQMRGDKADEGAW